MRIGINARLLHSPDLRGWNRYTVNLLAELSRLDLSLFLYTDRPLHDGHLARLQSGQYEVVESPTMAYPLWEQAWLPNQCRRDRVDLLHSPYNFGLPWSSRCPRVLTLHDAIDVVYRPDDASGERAPFLSRLKDAFHHQVARTRAHRVITVSRHARQDLVAHLRVAPERIDVIHEAADPGFLRPAAASTRRLVRDQYGLGRPYLFYIGGWERRKNLPFLLRAFAEAAMPGLDLVLGGGRQDQRGPLMDLGQSLGVGGSIKLLGWVEETDLTSLYGEALGFVYPSEYEGFGLQLCEAMAVGCPVLASDRTSLPEILGSGGETFPLDSTAPLASLIRRLASEPDFRSRLVAYARRRSADFSWEKTARETLETYRKATSRRNGAGSERPPESPASERSGHR